MEPSDQTHCKECGREKRHGYESVHYTESEDSSGRSLCFECYNQEMADYSGIDFQHPKYQMILQ